MVVLEARVGDTGSVVPVAVASVNDASLPGDTPLSTPAGAAGSVVVVSSVTSMASAIGAGLLTAALSLHEAGNVETQAAAALDSVNMSRYLSMSARDKSKNTRCVR